MWRKEHVLKWMMLKKEDLHEKRRRGELNLLERWPASIKLANSLNRLALMTCFNRVSNCWRRCRCYGRQPRYVKKWWCVITTPPVKNGHTIVIFGIFLVFFLFFLFSLSSLLFFLVSEKHFLFIEFTCTRETFVSFLPTLNKNAHTFTSITQKFSTILIRK